MIYIDVNILVDVMSGREGWKSSIRLLQDARDKEYEFGISTLTVYILHYVLKEYNPSTPEMDIREQITNSIQNLELLSLDSEISRKALESDFDDFEDAIQYETAKKNKCPVIITRNEFDFRKAKDIEIWKPEDYYEMRM